MSTYGEGYAARQLMGVQYRAQQREQVAPAMRTYTNPYGQVVQTPIRFAPADRSPGTVYANDRDESEACEAGTPGCSVDHTRSAADTSCETW